ncbi:MAG: hypothetical protein ABSA97_09160 [Verrucomicrobiia bacterium]
MPDENVSGRDAAIGGAVREQYTRAPFPPVSFFPIVQGAAPAADLGV